MAVASARAAVAAVAFLTRVPVGRRLQLDAADVSRGAVLFPVVGAAIGAVAGLAAAGLEGPLPPLVAGGLAVGLAVALTGALHLDALADSADALGAVDRERALEIMRDPRIGALGFAVAGGLSRAVAAPLARALPYARPGGGVGSVLSGRVPALASLAGAGLALGLAVLLLGWDGIVVAGAATGTAAACGLGSRLWLGGVTGDTLGATTQATEIVALVVLVAIR